LTFGLQSPAGDASELDSTGTVVVWYSQPAAEWTEALPIGNGRLGGMIFGNPTTERLHLNEESLWGGSKIPNNNPGALSHLSEIRDPIIHGDISKMLLQSRNGVIGLLRAIPAEWASGSIEGLQARGRFEASIESKNRELQAARIRSVGGESSFGRILESRSPSTAR
jgi:hypothetical protein